MKLYLKTLSQLHIGSGRDLESLDYIELNSFFYKLGNHSLTEFLTKYHLVNEYQDYSKAIYEELEKINVNTEKNRKRKELGLDFFCDKIKKFGYLEEFLESNKKIQKIPIKNDIQLSGNKVREQIRDGLQNPYIPGSTIKGAIRTALFYHWLNNYANENKIIETFEKDLKKETKDKLKKSFAENLKCLAFYCEKENQEKYDEKFDLMKLLLVSDGKIVCPQPVQSLIIEKPNLFLISAEKQPQATPLEAIKEDCFIEFELQFNIQFLYSVKDLIKNDAISINGKKEWIKIKSKCKELFGLNIDTLTKENLETKEKEVIDFVLRKVKDFSIKQIDKHQQWKDKINRNPKKKDKNDKREFFDYQKINFDFIPKDKNILHLGFGTGFIGTTEFLYFIEKESLQEKIVELFKKFTIGKARNSKEEYNPTIQDIQNAFPKSRLMYEEEVNGKKVIKPMSWVQIMDEKEYQELASLSEESVKKGYEPEYFKDKLKQGVILDAQFIGKDLRNPKLKKFKLFIQEPGKEQECTLSYNSDLEEGIYVKVKVNSVDKNGKVQSITFMKIIQ